MKCHPNLLSLRSPRLRMTVHLRQPLVQRDRYLFRREMKALGESKQFLRRTSLMPEAQELHL
jgi:hypothetical protein